MKTPLIAFTGLAGSGKSSFALGLVRYREFVRLSFADPIRGMLSALGVSNEQMAAHKNDPLDLLGGKSPRQAMQSLGTEWGRNLVSPDLWVNAVQQRILDAWNIGRFPGVVIDDCRFDNEATMVKNLGGLVIEIVRGGISRMDHPSERGVSPHLIDQRVGNDFKTLSEVFVAAVGLV